MMLRRVLGCLVLGAFVLVASPASEATTKRRRSRPFIVTAHTVDFTRDAHPTRRRRAQGFEGYETHTIEFDVFRRSRSTTTEHPTQIKLYLPNGDLYSEVDLVPGEPAGNDKRRKRRAPEATARVRVSGTVITRYGLYGDWRADVCWTTGSLTSCRRALSFDIH